MKKLQIWSLILLLASVVGCTGDSTVSEVIEPPVIDVPHHEIIERVTNSPSSDRLSLECVDLLYPVGLIVDGTLETINSQAEYWSYVHGDYIGIDFDYPVDVEHWDGSVTQQNSAIELSQTFASCIPHVGWSHDIVDYFSINLDNSCVELVYPLQVSTGTIQIVVNQEAEAVALVSDHDHIYFSYPLQLRSHNSSTAWIHNGDELYRVLFSCHVDTSADISHTVSSAPHGCYEITYPHAVRGADGQQHIVDSKDAYYARSLLGEFTELIYPLSMHNGAGLSVTAYDEPDLTALTNLCADGLAGDILYSFLQRSAAVDSTPCHSLIYPITIYSNMSNEATLYDNSSVQDLLATWTVADVWLDYRYPLSIVYNNDEQILENFDDLIHHLITCR